MRQILQCYVDYCFHKNFMYQFDSVDLILSKLYAFLGDNLNTLRNWIGCAQECSQKLKSYKFLPLMHQLAARMSSKAKDNQLFLLTLNTVSLLHLS